MGFDEADIRAGLSKGGTVRGAFIVGRGAADIDDVRYVAYLRTSWRRGYRILQTFRHKGDKIYVAHGLHRLVWLLRKEFGVQGPLVVYEAGSAELQRFLWLQPIDRGPDPDPDPEPPRDWPFRHPIETEDDSGKD